MNTQRPRIRTWVWAALLLGLAVPLLAQEPADARPKRLKDYGLPGLDAKVSLKTIDAWDVVQLIEFLAYRGGLNNIVIGKGVQGLTTKLKFDNVTVGDALEVVLSVNNLAYEVKGGIVTIMTDEEYRAAHGASFYDNKQVRVVELKYADPVRVASMLEPVKSSIGTVVADPITGTLILIDTPGKIAELKAIVERADLSTVSRVLPTETKTFVLQYASMDDVVPPVTESLTKEAGSIRTDRKNRTMVVTDLPHSMRKIEDMIQVFDRRPRQVFIESKIMQVSLGDENRLGVNWDHLMEGIDPRYSLNAVASPGKIGEIADAANPSLALTYKTIVGGRDLSVVLEALKKVGDTKVLSNPHVAVLDGEEAQIKVVTDQPYAEAQLESGTTNVVGESVKFIEVGVTLGVTPRVNDNSMISCAIKPEVSTVVGNYQAFRTVPIVRRSFAETTVMIKDSETIIIAGMIENEKDQTEVRVPVLGSIPLLGALFRTSVDKIANRELVVFLTPRIISGEEPVALLQDMKKTPKPARAR